MTEPVKTSAMPRTVGILLVHGIGAQRKGETLLQGGNTILQSLDALLKKAGYRVELENATLSGAGEAGAPANATIRIHPESSEPATTWKLAESHWADEFPVPSYWQFCVWAFGVLPLLMLLHLAPGMRNALTITDIARGKSSDAHLKRIVDHLRRLLRTSGSAELTPRALANDAIKLIAGIIKALLAVPLMVLLGVVVQLFLVLVAMVAWLPFDFIKSMARLVQLGASVTLGDSYLFTNNPLLETAMISKVRCDIDWLARHCDDLIVVAHSQGAAVVHRALECTNWKGDTPDKLKSFVSYGSGLQKLMDLRIGADELRKARLLAWGCVVILLAMAAAAVFLLLEPNPKNIGLAILDVLAGWLVMLYLFARIVCKFSKHPNTPKMSWLNLYASHDPVANGHVEFADTAGKFAADHAQLEVCNFSSRFQDHTSYWQNRDGFVARLIAHTMRTTDMSAQSVAEHWLNAATERRRWRIGLLMACRKTCMLMALVMLWPTKMVAGIGASILAEVVSVQASHSGWFGSIGKRFQPGGDYANLGALWKSLEQKQKWVVGSGSVLLVILVLYGLARVGWNFINRRDIAPMIVPGVTFDQVLYARSIF